MATPRDPSPQGMNVSRDMRRSFLGGRNGRTGLSPVKRQALPTAIRTPGGGSGILDYGYIAITSAAAQAIGAGLTDRLRPATVNNQLANGAAATWSAASGLLTVDTAGLWCVVTEAHATGVTEAFIRASSTAGGLVSGAHNFSAADAYAGAGKFLAGAELPPVACAVSDLLYGEVFTAAAISVTYSTVVAWPIVLF